MASVKYDPERVRVIRELLLEAEAETFRTATDAVNRQGAVTYLQAKLKEAGRVQLNGD
jgi:hypothetical protein